MSSSQLMRPDQDHNSSESEVDQWMESVKEAAKTDPSARKKEEAGFLQQTGVQVTKLAHEAAERMKNAVTKNKDKGTPGADEPVAQEPTNNPSFREYTP